MTSLIGLFLMIPDPTCKSRIRRLAVATDGFIKGGISRTESEK